MTRPADTRTSGNGATPIGFATAVGTWATSWLLGTVAAVLTITALGGSGDEAVSIPQLAAGSLALWTVMGGALYVASRRFGSGDPLRDYAASFRPIDLLGVPVGVATQLAVVPLLYVPLRRIWPETFDEEEITRRAQDLVDRAGGWSTVLLAVVVVVGAPLVEEFVYRGLLQRSAATAIGAVPSLLMTSLVFMLVHFSPVEYPGLFVAGLVFGAGVLVTGRIGPAIVTHAAFNLTGLVVVLRGSG